MPKITLAAARKNKNLTQQEVADFIGVCKGSIVKWENGYAEPSVSKALKLCALYEMSINDILFCPEVN